MGGLGWGDAMMTFFSGNGEAPCELYWALPCPWKVNNAEWLFRHTTTQEQDWGVELLSRNMRAHMTPEERTYWGSTMPPALQKHLAHSSHPHPLTRSFSHPLFSTPLSWGWGRSLSWSVSISEESEPGQAQQPSQHTANSVNSGN